MAKKKKRSIGGDAAVPMSSSSSGRLSTDITDAENGFIVNVSGETGGKENRYFSKRFVAGDREEALRIAASHLSGGSSRKAGKKKASNKKKISLKRG